MTKRGDIIWLESVDSTNTEAQRRISDIDNLSVLSALSQSRGRGQRGNTWSSAPGENLTFSIVLKFGDRCHLRACDHFVLCEIAALSVVDFLAAHNIRSEIKWPNDIYVDDKKICGMLIENSLKGDGVSHSIIGIGLNINQRNFDVNLPNPTSMSLITGQRQDIREALEELADIFSSYYKRYCQKTSGYTRLRTLYLAQLWRLGTEADYLDYTHLPQGHLEGSMNLMTEHISEAASVSPEGRRFTGIIRGLSPIGNLLVQDIVCGETKEYGFKEIGYIL